MPESTFRSALRKLFAIERSASLSPAPPESTLTTPNTDGDHAAAYQSRVAAELATFENDEVVHDLPEIFHYWSGKYLSPKIEAFGFSHPDDFFTKKLAANMAADGSPTRFISIGAGNCDTEVRIAKGLLARGHSDFVIECLEINTTMLKRGQEFARVEGVSAHIVPTVCDFNHWQPDGHYHAVMANHSLHHVVNLEGLFDSVAVAIKATNGVFVTSDMIGRNGHQHWPEALALIEQFWSELAPRFRYNRQLRRQEDVFVNWDSSAEGFEGIRAQDILPLLVGRFHFDLFVPFAGVISPFTGRGFGPNFDVADAVDRAFIDRIQETDESEIAAGRVKPTQMFAVMSLDYARPSEHIAGLKPEFCIRIPD